MFSLSKVTGRLKAGVSAYAKKALMSIVVAGILLGAASSISADPITVGIWHSFTFEGPGSFGSGSPGAPWTFTLGPGGQNLPLVRKRKLCPPGILTTWFSTCDPTHEH